MVAPYAKPRFGVGSIFITQTHLPGGVEIDTALRQTFQCPHGQSISWDAKINLESFRGGDDAMAILTAIKDVELSGSLESPILAQMMSAIMGGTASAGLMRAFTPTEPTHTDDVGAAYNIDITDLLPVGATFVADLGVTTSTVVPLTRVADAATAGTYSVGAGGNYKFGASGEYFVFASYSMTQTGSRTVELNPIKTGAPPMFSLRYATSPLGKSSEVVEFDCVVFSSFKSEGKLVAFSSDSMDFTIMVSPENKVGRISRGEG